MKSPVSVTDEIEALLPLLAEEKEAERQIFQEEWLSLALSKRRELGVTCHPVQLDDARLTLASRWRISFRFDPAAQKRGSPGRGRFAVGQNVEVFGPNEAQGARASRGARLSTHGSENESERIAGVIAQVSHDRIVVICDESPDWLERAPLGIDLSFSDSTYREMEAAVRAVAAPDKSPSGKKLARLRTRILIPAAESDPARDVSGEPPTAALHEQLNEAQRLAAAAAVSLLARDDDFVLIHGPPGTGKTTTLVAAVAAMLIEDPACDLLITAPTNAAVDYLAECLLEAGVGVLRLGHPARIDERLWQCSLEGRIEAHASTPAVHKMRREAEAIYKEARRFRRNFGAAEAADRRAQLALYRDLKKEILSFERSIERQVLDSARVVLSTLAGAAGRLLRERRFSVCMIDEGSQALEPAAWIPVLRADRLVIAGDHQQLPPVVKSGNALTKTLFEKMVERHTGSPRVFFLNEQYRMVPEIMAFPNIEFYEGRLICAPRLRASGSAQGDADCFGFAGPFVFVDTAGAEYTEVRDPETLSCYNEGEARLTGVLCRRILDGALKQGLSAGVIAPYRAQTELMRTMVPDSFEVDTVDSFQGRERDIILISLVRCNDEGDTGFLGEIRRMNVALTRARSLLVVVGDSVTLSYHPFYDRFLAHARAHADYRSAFEFME